MIVTIHSSLAEVDRAEWDALADTRALYLTHRWLGLVETSEKRGRDPTYVTVRDDGGRLVGALPCHYLEEPPSWLYDPVRAFEGCERIERTTWFPAVVAGGVSEFRGDVLVAPDLSAEEQDRVVEALVAGARDVAARRGAASLLFLYMPVATAQAIARAVSPAPAHVVFQDVEQVLRASDATPEQYVQRLPKGRRETVRREMREYAESDSTTVVVPFAEAPLDDLARMHTNLMRKYGHEQTEEQALASFESQQRHYGDLGLAFLSVRDGTPTGFSLCYEHQGSLYVRSTGYDYDAETPFAYSNLMFYEPLRLAMERGWHDLQLGLSTNRAKLLRGADALPLYAVLLPTAPVDAAAIADVRRCSDERIASFWEQYGHYAVHQVVDDLRLPETAP